MNANVFTPSVTTNCAVCRTGEANEFTVWVDTSQPYPFDAIERETE